MQGFKVPGVVPTLVADRVGPFGQSEGRYEMRKGGGVHPVLREGDARAGIGRDESDLCGAGDVRLAGGVHKRGRGEHDLRHGWDRIDGDAEWLNEDGRALGDFRIPDIVLTEPLHRVGAGRRKDKRTRVYKEGAAVARELGLLDTG